MWFRIQHNPYLVLLMATTIEGPIATFVSAGLAAQHILHLEYVIIITIIGDVIGDMALFFIGRYLFMMSFVQSIITKIPKKDIVSASLQKRPLLYLTIAKMTPYLSTPTLIFAGSQQMNTGRFLVYSLLISSLVKAVYITLGYFGGVSVQQLEGFLFGRQKIILYLVVGLVFFFGARIVYYFLSSFIKKRFK